MFTSKIKFDGLAISLSLLCLLHCFFTPTFIILAPSILSFSFNSEFFHYVILLFAIPISVYALYVGFKQHNNFSNFKYGLFGLLLLFLALIVGEKIIGEYGEKGLTLFGSVIVTIAHFKNIKICKDLDCNCHTK